jgi:hypothetical protein
MNLFSQFADKILNSKAMGYLPKKWEKNLNAHDKPYLLLS